MNRLWLYNPENDIALGMGDANFTPPKNARLLSLYAAPLMWWMGDAADGVLVGLMADSAYRSGALRWLAEMERLFGPGPALLADAAGVEVGQCMPWGWSAHAMRRFAAMGVKESVFSSVAPHIGAIRDLSHRRSSIAITRAVAEAVDFSSFGLQSPVLPVEARSYDDAVRAAAMSGTGVYLKSPWSSSGRGVVYVPEGAISGQRMRIEAVIRNQGSIMVERAYDGMIDFAMLFRSDREGVHFIGYSRFFNIRGTAYAGNLVASDTCIRQDIGQTLPDGILDALERALPPILTRLLAPDGGQPLYRGYLGIDMMVARAPGASCGVTLVPCVELNLRTTMGTVAHELYRRAVAAGQLSGQRFMLSMSASGSGRALVPPHTSLTVPLIPPNPHFSMTLSAKL